MKEEPKGSQSKIALWIPIILILIICILVVGFIIRPACFIAYPGQFVYQEYCHTDTPEETLALNAAETFNYTLIPSKRYTLWETYLDRTRLNHYATQSMVYNPFLFCGTTNYTYTAQVTWLATVNVTIHTPRPHRAVHPLNITTGPELLFPYPIPDYGVGKWAAGYWNTSRYEDIQQSITLNYTNVFLVDMQLWNPYYGGLLAAGTRLEIQQVIVDETGTILFVYWASGHVGPIA